MVNLTTIQATYLIMSAAIVIAIKKTNSCGSLAIHIIQFG
ncbi:hypothetical protein N473_10765 [Pseudoalteromonas luteoviolacea CPMOR-1]|uniref:Uncharacterized protein n=1 Tax=Pseudoalteromonas luteoviolacea CPMOR-1 TaxID=1365248 RepID=A0A167MAN3_9GAMM|nr:hypothetical protein N473_10765 [Pseudoalteromonas luteoviolacea CPMOR-1]